VLIAAVALAGAWALQRRYPSGADEPSDAEAAVGPR
jgi:hypothetical protein